MNEKSFYKYNILIFGTGALGSVFGGFLQKKGYSVTYVGLGEHFKAVLKDGIRITGIWGDYHIKKINGFLDYQKIKEKFDIILLCVKSIHTKKAIEQASTLLSDDGIVVSIQNGLKNTDKIAILIGKKRTVGGRIIFGVENPRPGTVKVSVYADKVLLGFPFMRDKRLLDKKSMKKDPQAERLSYLIKALNKSCIPTKKVGTKIIVGKIWEKILYNAALNPLGALFEVPYGELGKNFVTNSYIKNIIKEIFKVVKEKEIWLSYDTYEEYFKYLKENQLPATKDHHSSMLQDIKNGRKTEIDAMNGAIVQYGKELNLETPYNTMLVKMIKAKEIFNQENKNQ